MQKYDFLHKTLAISINWCYTTNNDTVNWMSGLASTHFRVSNEPCAKKEKTSLVLAQEGRLFFLGIGRKPTMRKSVIFELCTAYCEAGSIGRKPTMRKSVIFELCTAYCEICAMYRTLPDRGTKQVSLHK